MTDVETQQPLVFGHTAAPVRSSAAVDSSSAGLRHQQHLPPSRLQRDMHLCQGVDSCYGSLPCRSRHLHFLLQRRPWAELEACQQHRQHHLQLDLCKVLTQAAGTLGHRQDTANERRRRTPAHSSVALRGPWRKHRQLAKLKAEGCRCCCCCCCHIESKTYQSRTPAEKVRGSGSVLQLPAGASAPLAWAAQHWSLCGAWCVLLSCSPCCALPVALLLLLLLEAEAPACVLTIQRWGWNSRASGPNVCWARASGSDGMSTNVPCSR